MLKSDIRSWKTQVPATFSMENVLQVNIQNYSDETIFIIWNGFERPIPPVDAVLGIPTAPFRIYDYGNEFNVEIDIDIATKTGNVIIDYSVKKSC